MVVPRFKWVDCFSGGILCTISLHHWHSLDLIPYHLLVQKFMGCGGCAPGSSLTPSVHYQCSIGGLALICRLVGGGEASCVGAVAQSICHHQWGGLVVGSGQQDPTKHQLLAAFYTDSHQEGHIYSTARSRTGRPFSPYYLDYSFSPIRFGSVCRTLNNDLCYTCQFIKFCPPKCFHRVHNSGWRGRHEAIKALHIMFCCWCLTLWWMEYWALGFMVLLFFIQPAKVFSWNLSSACCHSHKIPNNLYPIYRCKILLLLDVILNIAITTVSTHESEATPLFLLALTSFPPVTVPICLCWQLLWIIRVSQ